MQFQNIFFLIGDFNAHTSTKQAFFTYEDDMFSNKFNEPDIDISLSAEHILTSLQLPIERLSSDSHRVNNWGKYFLDCLCNINFIMCNGRYGPLSSQCTTVHNSVVDYFICSLDFLQNVYMMQVFDFNPLLSDVHMPIEVTFKAAIQTPLRTDNSIPTNDSNIHDTERVKKWNNTKQNEFIYNLNMTHFYRIVEMIDQYDFENSPQEQLDDIMNEISALFVNSGFKTFGKRSKVNKNRKTSKEFRNKPWYNTICRNKRIIFNRSRKKYQITKNKRDLENMKLLGKDYKREIIKAHMTYSDKVRWEVRQMRSAANKKAYWKYVKENKTENNTEDIDFKKFSDFFQRA